MKKVKEELLLSVIFVTKWLALGLGLVGVLYVAIYFAYHKSYYDPRIEKYDYEISVLQDKKGNLVTSIEALNSGLKANDEQINKLKNIDLPEAEKLINKNKESIDSLGLKWWEKIPVPMMKKNKNIEDAYMQLENAENNKNIINEKLGNLYGKQQKSNESKTELSDEIHDIDVDISEKKRNKERFEVDVKGPMLWLAGVLGLT